MLYSLENAIPKEWKEVLVHESIDFKEDNYKILYNKFTHLSNVSRIAYVYVNTGHRKYQDVWQKMNRQGDGYWEI